MWKKWGVLNLSFPSAVKNLNIPELSDINLLAERLSNPILKAILTEKDHPSIVAVRNANNNSHIAFNEVSVEKHFWKITLETNNNFHRPITVQTPVSV